MKRLRLVSKQLSSRSLRRLAEALTSLTGKKVYRSFYPKPNRINLYYGACKNKLYQYRWFHDNEISSLPFTTDKSVVLEWLSQGFTVVARSLLSSSEGKGITILEPEMEIVEAKVYTKYIPKKKEYRVHIFDDQVVSVLEKRRKTGTPSNKIRNTANGYVFCRENVVEPEGIRELALRASKVTDSHFKGVDIGYNEKKNLLFVIEVNSAPGMEGTTIYEYVNAINQSYSI